MNDPWPDVRERAQKARSYVDVGWPAWNWHVYSLEDVERILTDADALLAVKNEHMAAVSDEWKRISEDGGTERTLEEWIDDYYYALAALPKHLKGNKDERSRKA